jgi:ATP-binding cassette subfamily F protein uup
VALNNENTVLQEIGEGKNWLILGEERLTVWKYLRRFLFVDDRMNTKVGKLSAGGNGAASSSRNPQTWREFF